VSRNGQVTMPSIFPFLQYREGAAAVDWLEQAFGFERSLVHQGENGAVEHAELTLGAGTIMVGSLEDPSLGLKSPRDLEAVDQGIYVAIDDVDAHCARARAAGAEIVREPNDTSYGAREYMARDPEGHLWSFGTYVPEPPA
jgi:uncharacterized glyoxalase superfamily protein PhnB